MSQRLLQGSSIQSDSSSNFSYRVNVLGQRNERQRGFDNSNRPKNHFKCFKCFGLSIRNCRECSGSSHILSSHPLIDTMESILAKRGHNYSAKHDKEIKGMLTLPEGGDVIKQESFSMQEDSNFSCSRVDQAELRGEEELNTKWLQAIYPEVHHLRKISEQIEPEQSINGLSRVLNKGEIKDEGVEHSNKVGKVAEEFNISEGNTILDNSLVDICAELSHSSEGRTNLKLVEDPQDNISDQSNKVSKEGQAQIIEGNAINRTFEWEFIKDFGSLMDDQQHTGKIGQTSEILEEYERNSFHEYCFEGYQCDICKNTPIIGTRYHCGLCQDYDLCRNCFKEKGSQHQHQAFIEIKGELIQEMGDKQLKRLGYLYRSIKKCSQIGVNIEND